MDTDAAFLEREEVEQRLDAAFRAVRERGEGQLILVPGEAGVGKTTLLRRFGARQHPPARVLWGACEPLLTPRPLGPLIEIADALGSETGALLTRGAPPFDVTSALLRDLRSGPTALVLEDLHWADDATLDVVRLLARRVGSVPTLMLATFRDDELDRASQLRIVLGELAERPRRLKLAPLSRAGVEQLAASYQRDAEEVYRTTGGNPFFVTEVLEAGGEQVPETVRDAVLARALRLTAPARAVLHAAAVVPGQVELWLLEALAHGLGDDLEECLASGMLVATDDLVGFRHELARLAVAESMPPARRRTLHRAALAALEAPPDGEPDVVRLAHHAEAIADRNAVLRWAPRAAAFAASAGSHREAVAHYQRALRFADDLSPHDRAELLELLAREAFPANLFDTAIGALERAIELQCGLDDRLRQGNLLTLLARVTREAGKTPRAQVLAHEAVEILQPLGRTPELARGFATRAQLCMLTSDFAGASSWGALAVELAESLDDTETLVHALNTIGTARLLVGAADGLACLDASLRRAAAAGLDVDAGRAYNNIVSGALESRSYDIARAYVDQGMTYCHEHGLDHWLQLLQANRITLELDTGNREAALAYAQGLLDDPTCGLGARQEALVAIALIRARGGRPGVSELLDEASDVARMTGELQFLGPIAAARAEVAWLEGRLDTIAAHTHEAFELAVVACAPWVVGELACWRRRAGLQDDLAPGLAAEPYELSFTGDWAGAARHWAERGCGYKAALALADADSDEPLRRAHAELRALDAPAAAAVVARLLRARGVRDLPRGPRPRTRDNPAGLTARECEVAALLADGLRNAQIAERLVVSHKTVEHHVAAILRKLGATSRHEAGAEARRLGLADPG